MNRFVIAEPSKCIGCRTCEVACVLAHPRINGGGEGLSLENFKPRLKVVKSATVTAPVQCRQCENAPCVNSCPTEALVYSNGTVQLIAGRCIGCQTCVVACPFGAMEMVDVLVKQSELGSLAARRTVSQAHKCDMCVDRAEGPACIPACPTNALILIEPSALETVSEQRRQQALVSMEAAENR